MSKRRYTRVWDVIEDTPAQAENICLRSALMMALKDHIAREGVSQRQAAKVFGVTQPGVSDLTRGKLELFGLDSLVTMLAAAALHVEVRIARRLTGVRGVPEPEVVDHCEPASGRSSAASSRSLPVHPW